MPWGTAGRCAGACTAASAAAQHASRLQRVSPGNADACAESCSAAPAVVKLPFCLEAFIGAEGWRDIYQWLIEESVSALYYLHTYLSVEKKREAKCATAGMIDGPLLHCRCALHVVAEMLEITSMDSSPHIPCSAVPSSLKPSSLKHRMSLLYKWMCQKH